jgi:hypothetical protein
MLDQSFNDAPALLKSKRVLPRRGKPEDIMTFGAPLRPSAPGGNAPVQKPGRAASSPLPSPYSVNGNETGLPPTPPSNLTDTNERTSYSPRHAQRAKSSLSRKASTSTTHLDQRSPPTPDLTPPGSLNVPQLSSPSGFSSTRAESFRTAREEQWSSDEEEPASNGHVTGPVKPVGNRQSRDRDTGLGLEFEREGEDTTPTQHPLSVLKRRKTSPDFQAYGMQEKRLEHIPDREWDTNLMRNVTVRRKKNPQTQPKEDERRISERDIVPQLTAASSEESELEPQTPSVHEFTHERVWSSGMIQRKVRDDDSNRLSVSSTVIEALVVPSPSQRRRKLRHVSRNLSLRSEAGSSAESSPVTRSIRTSLISEDSFAHRLHHKPPSMIESRRRSSPTLTGIPATPPKSLKHHRESGSLRSDADAYKNNCTLVRQLSQESGPNSSTAGSRLSGSSFRPRDSSAPTIMMSQRSPPRERRSSGARLPKVQFKEPPKEPPNSLLADSNVTKTRVHSPTRSATQKALQRADSIGSQHEQKPRRSSADASMRNSRRVSTGPSTTLAENEPTGPSVLHSSHLDRNSHSLPTVSSVEEFGRPSLDRLTTGSYETARLSVDHSIARSDEHAMARHLYAQTTPFSQTSDTLEVSEATAVSIYPHNNKSLVVVEQAGRTSAPLSQLSVAAEPLAASEGYPPLLVQPATPPQILIFPPNVDSPLRNPRKPPKVPLQLPAIRVLPATPAKELEDSPLDTAKPLPTLPTRSLSLKERARRYSTTIVRPIITRTTSLRRSYYGRPRSPYQQQDDAQRRTNLHPLWQPRGFWDEFSDSDSDFGEPEAGSARLPPGGDTSDVPEPRGGFGRVLDGFRGSGGFLIGNSMGLERHGTNNRRHYISVPAGKRSVVRKTSQGTMKSMSSSNKTRSSGSGDRRVWKGLGLEFHYIGVSAMRNRLREKKREKNREKIRKSIGPRFAVEGAPLA